MLYNVDDRENYVFLRMRLGKHWSLLVPQLTESGLQQHSGAFRVSISIS